MTTTRRSPLFWLGSVFLLTACTPAAPPAEARGDEALCRVAAAPQPLPGLAEASGLTASRRTPGLIWSHNDSGAPEIVALDRSGARQGRVRVTNAEVHDWEDVSAGACGSGSCLYIADIGDNDAARADVRIYRVPEPSPADTATAAAQVIVARYPDGARDAEAAFVGPGGDLFVVTKEKAARVYRLRQQAATGPATLEAVAVLPLARVTDAEASPDGRWVALRTNDDLVIYGAEALARGEQEEAGRMSLRDLGEAQGEGVAILNDGTVFLVSEGGGENRPGALSSLRCTVPTDAR